MKPQTYMNLSGEAVGKAVRYYHLDPERDILVIYDDLDLPAGKIRLREKGSAGGHNGLKSVQEWLGSDKYPRIKIGVGKKPAEYILTDWVLGRLPAPDLEAEAGRYGDILGAVELMAANNYDKAMNLYN